MRPYSVADRLNQIMKDRNLKQVDILNLTKPYCEKFNVKLSKSALSHYVDGKVEPRQDKMSILSYALSVSEAWLMGFDVPMERKTPIPDVVEDGRKVRLVELFGRLPEDEQDEIISLIEWKLSRR